MNAQDFNELIESIKQAGAIKRDILEPSRVFEFSALDIKEIRQNLEPNPLTKFDNDSLKSKPIQS